jgi:hypothetical protein
MGNLFFQVACFLVGISWAIAGNAEAASTWLAASIVIGRMDKNDR